MQKIRCILVDDEPLSIALLKNHIEQLDFMEVSATCPNALKALALLRHQQFDLMFLDIHMPGITGMELLKTLRHPPKTIITTAYREYALDGYELDIVDYLLKPITFDRFFKSVEKFLRGNKAETEPGLTTDTAEQIFIKSGHKHLVLNTDNILYIESSKDYIRIVTTEKQILSKYKISDVDKVLTDKGFLRIHRSFIVNLKKITAFTRSDIEIGKIELPIGESYREFTYQALKNYSHVLGRGL